MKRLFQISESKFATAFCLLFSIANRVIFSTLYSEIGRDVKVQITMAKNFLAGKGLGVTKYFSADINTPVFDKHQLFPPGFSFSIMPFWQLFKNEYSAVLAFDIVVAIAFIFSVRSLAKRAGLTTSLVNILTLIAGCSQYSFFVSGTSSDTAGLLFILVSLNILIRIVEKRRQLNIARLLLYALVFFLPAFFRYMYLPVSILFPVLIFAYGAINKNKELKRTGLWLAGFVGLFVFVMLFCSYQYGGAATHVFDTERGVFIDQLIHWYPYIPASFINLDFLGQLIAKLTGVSYTNAFKFFEIVNVVLLFTLLFLFFLLIRSLKKMRLSKSEVFIMSGAVISLCILLLLTYFSLTYKPQLYGIYLWNYNYESRYFAFLFIFFPILFFLCVHIYPQLLRNIFSRIVISFMLIIFAVEVLHGIYYNVKIIGKHKDIELVRDRVADFRQFPAIMGDLKTKYPDRELLVSASDQFFLYSASEMGYRAIFDYTNLNKKDLLVQKKCILLFPIHETDLWLMKEYLERKKPQLLNKIAGTVFYIEEINP